jgi:hypothetical protein
MTTDHRTVAEGRVKDVVLSVRPLNDRMSGKEMRTDPARSAW